MEVPQFEHILSRALHDALWRRVQAVFVFDPGRWHELRLNGRHLGYLNDKWRRLLLRDWTGRLKSNDRAVYLETDDWLAMGDRLQNMAAVWRDTGELSGWRNEAFSVRLDGETLFDLERAAFRPLGLYSHAVHINGLSRYEGQWRFWIARRSPYKTVDPGKLDNMVGGGVAAGESVSEALCREGWEEAGLPDTLLAPLVCRWRLDSLRTVSRGLHRECLHVYHAVLRAGTAPENQDGEVAGFELFDAETLAGKMCAGEMMNDALLATLAAFADYGLLDEAHPLAQFLAGQVSPAEGAVLAAGGRNIL
ncbi:NUDIX domain-containing protein [Neisseria leonii]|uniref:NUDIX domain-containing protein n=1 Tax=Neisseria leonii TaxID=2995413 RepID=A0A9X4E3A7_9NEIS|nr:NUDIX domain-containing protein [Neisseria sp. 51.81]MDD9327934.1 NUDIX domain-containing protein [Neisseria sp. 51.81]